MTKIAVIGAGYWGSNLLRVFANSRNFHLVAVADSRADARLAIAEHYPGVQVYEDAIDVIQSKNIDAVALATPVSSHYGLAKQALESGLHVLVEKPICSSSAEAAELVRIADAKDRVLMVDHTFLFHPAVRKLSDLLRTGQLGTVCYYDSLRVNLGLFQPDVNVLWDLAPHDLSIIDYLFNESPAHVEASGYCHLNPGLPDIAYLTLHFPSRMVAHLNLSWMSPVKVRRVALGGTEQMAVWDDLDRDEPLRIFDSGVRILDPNQRSILLPQYHLGDVHAPRLPRHEPLAAVAEHFNRVICGEEPSLMSGHAGLRIVRTLELAQMALDGSMAGVQARYTTALPHLAARATAISDSGGALTAALQ